MKKLLISLFASLTLSAGAWADSSATPSAKPAAAATKAAAPVKLSAQELNTVSAGHGGIIC
jgi:hypothetical protein